MMSFFDMNNDVKTIIPKHLLNDKRLLIKKLYICRMREKEREREREIDNTRTPISLPPSLNLRVLPLLERFGVVNAQ
jgi:hypothetical protein